MATYKKNQFTPLPQYGPAKPSKPNSSLNMSVVPKPKPGAVYKSGPNQNITPLPKLNSSNVPQMSILPGGKLPQMSVVPNSGNQNRNISQNMSIAPKPGTVYTSGPYQNISPSPVQNTTSTVGKNTNNNTSSRQNFSNSNSGTNFSTGVFSTGSTSTPKQGGLATPTGAATIGSTDFNYNKTPQQIAEEEALRRMQEYNNQQSQQDLNYNNIMQDTLRQFQGEIDATNQVYADKLRVAGIQGQNRLGQQRAENFNAGAVNSSFGNAAQDRTQSYNNDVEAGIQAQKLQSLAQIESSARELGNKYYEQKKAAKESGLAGYLENIKSAGTQKEAIAQDIANSITNTDISIDEISPAKLELIAKNAGVTVQSIKNAWSARQQELQKLAKEGQFDLSEGEARYDAQGNLIASRAKTYAPKSGGGSGGGSGSSSYGGGGGTQVSSAAQNILNQLNTNGGTVDDYIKGSSKDAQKLRNEVYTALNNQGGRNDVSTNLLKDARDVVNDLITTKSYKDLGGYSTRLGGQFTQSFGDAKARVAQLSALLARDNLGLLKGAMSDKDLAFIQAMSTGFEGQGVQSEKYIKEKLDTIYTKLNNKVGNTNNVVSSTSNKTTKNTGTTSLKGPDGKRYSVPNDQVDAFIKAGGSRI